jgi:hypothetical protein
MTAPGVLSLTYLCSMCFKCLEELVVLVLKQVVKGTYVPRKTSLRII